MRPVEIKKGIYWVGGIDWDLRNFHGYLTQRGSTYNAYLIVDDKIVLVDTVKHYLYDEMISRISKVVDPSKIDTVISNHVEMDHSGSLPRIMDLCPGAKVITSPNGEKGLRSHYGGDWEYQVVNTGDTFCTGEHTVHFVLTQMVHWPDSMVSYIPGSKLLLPNDAFGQHIASSERFDDELPYGIVEEEAAKYYANIVLPYGAQVKKALGALADLDIDMIAPSHGVIWRKNIDKILALYRRWSEYECGKKAVIVYDSMWGSTAKIAGTIFEAFEEKGIQGRLMDLKTSHMSDIMTYLLDAEYICAGSPTLNNGMMPTVAAFLTYMKGLSPKGDRKALAFGSYGWGGQSIGQVNEILGSCGFETMDPVRSRYVPGAEELEEIKENVKKAIG